MERALHTPVPHYLLVLDAILLQLFQAGLVLASLLLENGQLLLEVNYFS